MGNNIINEWLKTHMLIAGTTGSGKTVLLDNIIFHISNSDPAYNKLVLIDPKRLSFRKWRTLPHVIKYDDNKEIATEPHEITNSLLALVNIMENRYKQLAEMEMEKLTGNPIYVVIDELANVMLDKANHEPLYKLLTLARAADIHIIAATQNPSRDVLPGKLQCCFEGCRIGLKCSEIESRMIIKNKMCSTLTVGYCLALQNGDLTRVKIPYIDRETIKEQIAAINGKWEVIS